MVANNVESDGDVSAVVGTDEVPVTPGGMQVTEEGKSGAINKLRTMMEEMEAGEDDMDEGGSVGSGREVIRGALLALEATGILTQDEEPDSKPLINACNEFNEPICLVMLWTVRHCCSAGTRFSLNCYRNWEQLLLRQPGDIIVILLIPKRVSKQCGE